MLLKIPPKTFLLHLRTNINYDDDEADQKREKTDVVKKRLCAQWEKVKFKIRDGLDDIKCSGKGKHSRCKDVNETLQFKASCSFVDGTLEDEDIQEFVKLLAEYLQLSNQSLAWLLDDADTVSYIYFVFSCALEAGLDLSNSAVWLRLLNKIKYIGRGTPSRPWDHFKRAIKRAVDEILADNADTGEAEDKSPSEVLTDLLPTTKSLDITIVDYLTAAYKKLLKAMKIGQNALIPGLARVRSHFTRYIAILEAESITRLGATAGLDIANKKLEDSFTSIDMDALPFMKLNHTLISQFLTAATLYQAVNQNFSAVTIDQIGDEDLFDP